MGSIHLFGSRAWRAASLAGWLACTACAVHADPLPCTPTLSQTRLDLGDIAPADLDAAERIRGLLALGKQRMFLEVTCSAPASFALVFRSAPGPADTYRLGQGQDAPLVRLRLSRAQVDGKAASLISSADPTRAAETLVLTPGATVRAQPGLQYAATSRLSLTVDTEVLVNGAARSGVDRDLSASGVFELVNW